MLGLFVFLILLRLDSMLDGDNFISLKGAALFQ